MKNKVGLGTFPLVGVFNEINTNEDDVVNPKPNPEVIEKELKHLGASKGECLIVGDSDKDIQTGKNSGIDTCLFYPKENEKFYKYNLQDNLAYKKEDLLKEKPTYIISNLLELL